MIYKNQNLCDFCFNAIEKDKACSHCGLSRETYQEEPRLLAPGTNILGQYIIGRTLGQGGFGATYLAFSAKLEKGVALKEYFPSSLCYRVPGEENIRILSQNKVNIFNKGAQRFFEEAKTISQFAANKNVVSVYEFFYANNTVYYSMEYLDGMDLKRYIAQKGGRLSEAEVTNIALGVCNALVDLHNANILHRDIAPDNIFVCKNGDIKLIDFGTAKQVLSEEEQSYSVVVKNGFAPVEQYSRHGKQGAWTDIYALGASMYYALTGRVPPSSVDRVDGAEPYFAPNESFSPEIKGLIKKCMEFRGERRYQSIAKVADELDFIKAMNESAAKNNTAEAIFAGVTASYDEEGWLLDSADNSKKKSQKKAPRKRKRDHMKLVIVACMAIAVIMSGIVLVALSNIVPIKEEEETLENPFVSSVKKEVADVSDAIAGIFDDMTSSGSKYEMFENATNKPVDNQTQRD